MILNSFVDIFKNVFLSEYAIVLTSCTIIVVMFVLKIYFYKKYDLISVVSMLGFIILSLFFKNYNWFKIIITILFILDALYAVAIYVIYHKISFIKLNKISEYMKNTLYDFYFSTNKKDKIVEVSSSYAMLINKSMNEIKKLKGFQTMMTELNIVGINGREVTEELALTFLYDYEKTISKFKTYRFTLEVEEQGYNVIYRGIVQPLYLGKYFIGRNVYLSKDRSSIIENLRSTLKDALDHIKLDKEQMYTLMSLTDQIVMYYDYNTKTYVMTEALSEFMKLSTKEISIDEFISMIHPDDVKGYEEQGLMINSLTVTRSRLRLKFNNEYYLVYDDSIYINKDSGLVSIIKLVNPNPTKDVVNSTIVIPDKDHDGDDLVEFEIKKINDIVQDVKRTLDTVVGEPNHNKEVE